MADNTFIKPEGYIKPDPETMGASPAAQSEDDIYEDAGDLEFNTDSKWQSLYLARVPKYVWESWSQLDDDAEIQIGTIRQTKIPKGNGQFDVCHYATADGLLLIIIPGVSVNAALLERRTTPNNSQRVRIGCNRSTCEEHIRFLRTGSARLQV